MIPACGIPCEARRRKVRVICEDHPLLAESEIEVMLVVCAQEAGIDRRRNIDLSAAQPVGDGVRDMLIEMKAKQASGSSCTWAMALQEARAAGRAQRAGERFVLTHLAQNLFAVIKEIRQRGVDLPEGEVRQSFHDLLGRAAVNLGLRVNVLNANSCAGNKGPRLTVPIRAKLDVRSDWLVHSFHYTACSTDSPKPAHPGWQLELVCDDASPLRAGGFLTKSRGAILDKRRRR
jgi:hypothetical protein